MAKEPTTVYVKSKALRCPICDGDRFLTHKTTMPLDGVAPFLDWKWAGKRAVNHVCVRCGYIYWFAPVKE